MPKSKSRKKLSPYHRKKGEEAMRKRELKNQYNSAIQNRKGSSTYKVLDINGQPNGIFGKLNENCANCALNFEHENERIFKLKTLKTDKHTQANEMEIIDAIFYIYGLTVSDWSNTLSLEDEESDFTSASEIVFSNGIVFCSKCTSALENVYTSHKRLKELGHNESLFVKALSKKYSCEIESKIKCDDENEVSSLNKSNLFDEELEFKEEDDSEETNVSMFEIQDSFLEVNFESNQLDDPLSVDGSQSLQSLNNLSHNVSEKNKADTLVPNNEHNLSLTEMQRKSSSRSKSKILVRQCQRHPVNLKRSTNKSSLPTVYKSNEKSSRSVHKTRRLTKNLSERRVPQKGKRVVRRKTILPKPKSTLHNHPFNILCCNESFVSQAEFVNHQLKSHSKDVGKPILVKCNICEILIPEDTVDNHMETFFIELWKKYFKCKTCDSQFKSAKELTEHLQTHDPKYKTLICNICNTPMQSDVQLIAHKLKNHSEESGSSKQVACNLCGKVVAAFRNLQSHMKRKHLDRVNYKYICSNCNMKFSCEYFLEQHKIKSPNCHLPNSAICEKCGKSLLKRHMPRHMRQHEDIECPNKELFRCSQCGKMLKHRDSLQKHVLREHPEKEKLFFCENCGKSTKNMTNMRIHMKVHEKE